MWTHESIYFTIWKGANILYIPRIMICLNANPRKLLLHILLITLNCNINNNRFCNF